MLANHISHLLLPLVSLLVSSVFAYPTSEAKGARTVAHFPKSTWIENIAVRANGKLLVTTLLPDAALYQVDPFHPHQKPVLVANFTSATASGAFGIAELSKDYFFVATSNWTNNETAQPNTVWKINMAKFDVAPHGKRHIEKVIDISDAGALINGVTALDKRAGTLLLGDSNQGCVYALDTVARSYKKVQDHASMKAVPDSALQIGINGIHVWNGALYFTNTDQTTLTKVAIAKDGTAAGPYELVATLHTIVDDLAIGQNGDAYITTGPTNSIELVQPDGSVRRIAGGNANSTLFAGTTAAQFGRIAGDRTVLYVTTNGGLAAGTFDDGGRVVAVQTR
ncbi:uncharacterized protein EV422DRAFT_177033 [Fimicolochytrium jonesii]|uniref:uncharacterized protein n=1 Tax=Fimicolochytrium jonesii TaxID=1396493 RepID=UPI0022FEB2C1|nr:uncharacterized protein EV422DRAFT_177033 [Fimicolochytrium jonesii]KAI8818277.1 hypothetical protein EV422DRAFT_177033 [Fimicolochytrium jonesii]